MDEELDEGGGVGVDEVVALSLDGVGQMGADLAEAGLNLALGLAVAEEVLQLVEGVLADGATGLARLDDRLRGKVSANKT